MTQADAVCSGHCRPNAFHWQLDHIAHLYCLRRNLELVNIISPNFGVATARLAAGHCRIAGLAVVSVAGAVEDRILKIHIAFALEGDELTLGPTGVGLGKAVGRGEGRLNAACLISLVRARHHHVFNVKLLGVLKDPELLGDFPVRPEPRDR